MKKVNRFIIYFLGLFIIALGINLAILSNLGVSPVSAFVVPLSRVVQISLGTVTAVCYSMFVLIEIAVLGKQFKLKNLLQVPFSFIFGAFVDLIGSCLDGIVLNNYILQLGVLFLSIIVCAIGAVMYIAMDVVPNPPEGLILAFCERFNKDFGRLKIVFDCLFVVLGILISLIFLRGILDIREGTILSALITGKVISILNKHFQLKLKKIAFE